MSDDVVDSDMVAASKDAAIDVDAIIDADGRSEAERQRDDYLNSLQRLQADFENYRKRVTRLSEVAGVRAAGDLVVKLLPVLDAFDLAQAHFASGDTEEAIALAQARGLLLDMLSREGLERIDAVGVSFDPQIHDAVMHEEGDGEQKVDEVLRAGYRWKGGVVRPAMVRVKG